jgi:predicted nucleic acid-binding protein
VIAIADAGPVIHLSWVSLLPILDSQFEKVILPSAVHEELFRPPAGTRGIAAIRRQIEVGALVVYDGQMTVSISSPLGLGAGETEAISLALQLRGVFLTDDADARTEAEARGIPTIGTLGLLINARTRGDIAAMHPVLMQLRSQGFWLSQRLIDSVHEEEAGQ